VFAGFILNVLPYKKTIFGSESIDSAPQFFEKHSGNIIISELEDKFSPNLKV
jgi:hypothetical protein